MLIVAFAGCVEDPCVRNPQLAQCRQQSAVVDATIAAVNAQKDGEVRAAQMQATQDAIALKAQATTGAINAAATAIAVQATATAGARDVRATSTAIAQNNNAQSTQQAIELDALKASYAMSATVQAKTGIVIATQTALEGQIKIDQATAQATAAGAREWFFILLTVAAIGSLVVFIVWYSRRTMQAVTNAVTIRSNSIHYGPNNSRVAYQLKDPRTGQIEFIPIDQILGHSSQWLPQLQLPELAKLAAIIESDKRRQAVQIASVTGRAPMLGAAAEPVAALPTPDVTDQSPTSSTGIVPTLTDLLRTWQPTQDRMLFGYAERGPLYGRIDQLLSGEVIGRQGQGKTTLLRFIYAQCVLVGVQVYVWDLHEDIIDDLPGAQAFTTAAAIEQSSADVVAELDRRISQHEKGGTPLMILVDEINQLVNVVPTVSDVISRIVNEGRKYRIFVIVSAKGIPADLFGNSTVRDSFSSRFAFNTTTRQATMIGFDREVVPLVRDLLPGHALFEGPVPATVISVPFTSSTDVKNILATSAPKIQGNRATSATSGEVGSHFQATSSRAEPEVGAEVAPEVDERHAQVRDLLRAKTPSSQIIKQIWGVGPGGRRYQEAALELTQIMSELV